MKSIFIALAVMLSAGASQAEKAIITCNSAVGYGHYYLNENGKDYVMTHHEMQKDGSLKPTLKTDLYVKGSEAAKNGGVVLKGVSETQIQVDTFIVDDFEMHYPRNIERDALVIDFRNRSTGKITTIKMYCQSSL